MNTETQNSKIKVYSGQKPSPRDKFFKEWGLELVKNRFNIANELLKQQIALSTALLGASIIFDGLLTNQPKIKIYVIIAFLLSLVFAFIGLIPFERKNVWLDSPTEIEKFQRDAFSHKKLFYMLSGGGLMVGFIVILYNLLKIQFCQ